MLTKHSSLFQPGIGKISGTTAKLYLKPGAKPKFCRARTVPTALREKIEQEIARQVEEGILEQVNFSEWATPVVPVIKKDDSVRLCRDYKVTVNRASETQSYPLLKIDDILASLAGGILFSKLDVAHAYQQIILDDESKKVVTINTHKGLYQVNRLLFGVASAPSMFQRIMESILQCLPGVSVYINDILMTGKTPQEHLCNLDAVLTRLEEVGLRLMKESIFATNSGVSRLQGICSRNSTNGRKSQSSTGSSHTSRCFTAEVIHWTCELLWEISPRFIQCSCSSCRKRLSGCGVMSSSKLYRR